MRVPSDEIPACILRETSSQRNSVTLVTPELATCSYYSKASVYLPETKGGPAHSISFV